MFSINRESVEVPDREGRVIVLFVFLVRGSLVEDRDILILYYLVVSEEIYALRTVGRLIIRIKVESVCMLKDRKKAGKGSEPGK